MKIPWSQTNFDKDKLKMDFWDAYCLVNDVFKPGDGVRDQGCLHMSVFNTTYADYLVNQKFKLGDDVCDGGLYNTIDHVQNWPQSDEISKLSADPFE